MSLPEVDRRDVLRNLAALSAFPLATTSGAYASLLSEYPKRVALAASGPVISEAAGQVIEGLDVEARDDVGITIRHAGVTVRKCRVRHRGRHGIMAESAPNVRLENLEIERLDLPTERPPPEGESNNINLASCPGAVVSYVKATGGSANVYVEECPDARLSVLELHDARGPAPRGQNLQLNASPGSFFQVFSCENNPRSWTEDNISVYRSEHSLVRQGLVFYNNSPTGDGVMIEGSSNCLVFDVDAVSQGNGAFAAVPQGEALSGNCWFVRCRTRDSYNGPRDGRATPSSNSLSFYMRISPGAPRHRIIACMYDALSNPGNLIWKEDAVHPGWQLARRAFAPHRPLRLTFGW